MSTVRISLLVAGLLVVATVVACSSPRSTATVSQPAPKAVPAVAKPGSSHESEPGSTTTVQVEASDRVAPKYSQGKRRSPEIERLLATVDPDRVYQTAEAKPGVPALEIQGTSERRIQPGQSVTIATQGASDAVVTYMSREGGAFENGQASITVQADDRGLAQATFTAGPGTVDDVYVQIGSPNAIGTVSAVVHVLYPDSPLVLVPQTQP